MPDNVRTDEEINQLIADALPIEISDVDGLQDILDGLSGGGVSGIQKKIKLVDEIKISDVTMALDDELFVTLEANKRYCFYFQIFLKSHVSADYNYGYVLPSGATGKMMHTLGGGENFGAVQALSSEHNCPTDGNDQCMSYSGTILTDSTGGVFGLRWAQKFTHASNTTLYAGCSMIVWEID